jgi:flagellar protein FliS
MSASPHQLIVMLFDGAHSALVKHDCSSNKGIWCLKARRFHAISIIDNGLKAGLDMDVEGELPQNMASLYDYMVRRLLQSNLHNDVEGIIEVEGLLNNIADAWKQINTSASTHQDMR